jgi:hypothetical protein
MTRLLIGLCMLLGSFAFSRNSIPPVPPPSRDVMVYSEENMGAGARIFAGFNSQVYALADSKFYAKAEWDNGGTWYECHPVAAGVAQPACPGSVQEVGMDGVTTETLSDGIQLVGVNTQPAVANRHWKVRITLHLTPKP